MDDFDKRILKSVGLKPEDLTQEQIDLILLPSHAPENYYMDGEITPDQADKYHYTKLINSGLSVEIARRIMREI
jgi:hypothetical protein